ncbi:MAG: chemotaxis protein CheC [Methanolinea sp.]|jgi:chemotaxis protein CheC|nr:chemotaxis protein CheC [Methanolinea sp.]
MTFSPEQLDALQELTNIGAAHAATTLSQMLGCDISMSVPEIDIVDIADVGTILGGEVTTMILFQLQGDIPEGGFLILHFSDGSAIRTANIMCGMSETDRPLGEMDQSALMEVGNIMISSFLGASSNLLGIMMLPSPPFLVTDIGHAIIESLILQMGMDVDDVVVFRVRLTSDEHGISGDIFIFLDEQSLQMVAQLLEAMLTPPTPPL